MLSSNLSWLPQITKTEHARIFRLKKTHYVTH
jgi:hypothetical protein